VLSTVRTLLTVFGAFVLRCIFSRLGLIRFRGHFPKGGYDVHDGRDETETNPTQLQ
jgi:hypothetical protein